MFRLDSTKLVSNPTFQFTIIQNIAMDAFTKHVMKFTFVLI